jgi:hypothetical protein
MVSGGENAGDGYGNAIHQELKSEGVAMRCSIETRIERINAGLYRKSGSSENETEAWRFYRSKE